MASSPKQDRQMNSLGVSNQESQKVEVPVVQGQLLSEIGEQSSLLWSLYGFLILFLTMLGISNKKKDM